MLREAYGGNSKCKLIHATLQKNREARHFSLSLSPPPFVEPFGISPQVEGQLVQEEEGPRQPCRLQGVRQVRRHRDLLPLLLGQNRLASLRRPGRK